MAYKRQLIGDFEKARREHPSWPVVISEGDSWFSFSRLAVPGTCPLAEDR
jgi:hypothetical protein